MKKLTAVTTAQILEKVKDQVAPLPSQAEYMKSLAGLLAVHINRNLLIDNGYAPDCLPLPSAIVVAPIGQGKTYLLRKMVNALKLNLITVDCGTLVGESYKGVWRRPMPRKFGNRTFRMRSVAMLLNLRNLLFSTNATVYGIVRQLDFTVLAHQKHHLP